MTFSPKDEFRKLVAVAERNAERRKHERDETPCGPGEASVWLVQGRGDAT